MTDFETVFVAIATNNSIIICQWGAIVNTDRSIEWQQWKDNRRSEQVLKIPVSKNNDCMNQ